MKTNSIWKQALIFGGAYISMCVGASFGTGQELLQFFSSYGVLGALGAVVAVAAVTVLLFVCIFDARKYQCKNGEELFIHYGGKYLGRILYWFTMVSMMLSGCLLLSGAGATVEDYFGIPAIAGRLLIAVLVVLTVFLGLNKMVDVLGRLSIAILIMMIGVSIITILNPADGLMAGSALAAADPEAYRPASNWFMSGFMYFTWSILVLAAYATNLATNTKESIPVQNRGLILGNIGFAACAALPTLAIVANWSIAGHSQIPNIALGDYLHPAVGVIFSVVVIICIYTTICPYIWTACLAVAKDEKSMRYKITAVVCVIIGLIGASMGSFAQIVSAVTGLSARVGYVFVATMVFTKIFRKVPVPEKKD